MNFVLLLTTVSTLSFTVRFRVNNERQQDYFIFEGVNQSAHLFRQNSTLYLRCMQEERIALYETNLTDNHFNFSWLDFMIDNRAMKSTIKGENITEMKFDYFVLISPQFEDTNLDYTVNPNYELHGVNYWIIVGIVITGAMISRRNPRFREIFTSIMSYFHQMMTQHNLRHITSTVLMDVTDEADDK